MRFLPYRVIRQSYFYRESKRGLRTTAMRQSNGTSNQIKKGGIWVEANPRVCLHDVHTELRAGGLEPNSPVTLTADLVDENGKHFCSHGHFTTDEEGRLNLETATSTGGSYKGVFPAGLLATLSSFPNENKHYRLFRRNPQKPWKVTVGIEDGYVDQTNRKEPLAKVELERHLMAPETKRIPVRHGKVRGTLFLPPGPGPFPGIIDIYGFVGGLFEFRSAMMASRGFASLALAVFDYEDLPASPDVLHFEYFEEAVQFLLSQPRVIPDRCGVLVNSKSGDIGFSMAVLFEQVKALIGINALTFPMHTQYYFRGKPYMKGITIPQEFMKSDEENASYVDFGSFFNNDYPHMIPVETADDDTHFMVVCGDDDPFGFQDSINPFRERMKMYTKTNYETVLYKGAGHLIQTPYDALVPHAFQPIPQTSLKFDQVDVTKGITLRLGGKPQATSEAQVHLWQKMQEFFKRHVRDESQWFQGYLNNSN